MTAIAETSKYSPSLENQWWYLSGTGFDVKLQIDKLRRDASQKLSLGIPVSEIMADWIEQTSQDLESFRLEYILRHLVLPIKIEKIVIDGKVEIVASNYGNQPLLETASEKERNGAAKESVEKIVNFLSEAKPESIAVLISPAGWSGLKNSDGQEIFYPETQIYAFYVNSLGKIEAITIRTDTTLEENETLLSFLTDNQYQKTKKTLEERIEAITRNPVFFQQENFGFLQLVQAIKLIKNSPYINGSRTFEELFWDLKNKDKLLEIDEATKQLLRNFESFAKNFSDLDPNNLEILAQKLGTTVLAISAIERKQIIPSLPFDPYLIYKELNYLRSIGGCGGGGTTLSPNILFTYSLGGARKIFLENTETRGKHCGKCGKYGDFLPGEKCIYDKNGS
jgi:hypothetical protein